MQTEQKERAQALASPAGSCLNLGKLRNLSELGRVALAPCGIAFPVASLPLMFQS